jgi:hypothetical protein
MQKCGPDKRDCAMRGNGIRRLRIWQSAKKCLDANASILDVRQAFGLP